MNYMIDSEISLIDSNILVYAYDSNENDKHIISKNILNKCWKKEVSYALSTQNLSELFVVTTKKISNPISMKEMEENIKDIINFSNFQILKIKPKTILNAIKLSFEYKAHYWDSLIYLFIKIAAKSASETSIRKPPVSAVRGLPDCRELRYRR